MIDSLAEDVLRLQAHNQALQKAGDELVGALPPPEPGEDEDEEEVDDEAYDDLAAAMACALPPSQHTMQPYALSAKNRTELQYLHINAWIFYSFSLYLSLLTSF